MIAKKGLNTGTQAFWERRRRILKSIAACGVLAVPGWQARDAAGQTEDRRTVSIRDLGAIGDGRNNDRAAIARALMSSDRVFFPSGRYFLGSTKGGESVFDLRVSTRPTHIVTEPGVTLVVSTAEPGMPNVFVFGSGNDVRIGSLEIEDLGGVNDLEPSEANKWQGAIGVKIVPGRGRSDTLRIDRIVGKKLTAVVSVQGASLTERVRGINIGELHASECYYGFNCQENGDDVVIGTLTTERCRRSYFVYGVRNHRVNVVSRNGKGANADVLIKRYRFDTRDIDVTYRCEHAGTSGPGNLVVLEQQPPEGASPGQIANVRVAMSVNAPRLDAMPVLFRAWSPDGANEKTRTEDYWDQIELEFADMETRSSVFVDTRAIPSRRGTVRIVGAGRNNIGEKVLEGFNVQFARRP
jgi:hypothetical protein